MSRQHTGILIQAALQLRELVCNKVRRREITTVCVAGECIAVEDISMVAMRGNATLSSMDFDAYWRLMATDRQQLSFDFFVALGQIFPSIKIMVHKRHPELDYVYKLLLAVNCEAHTSFQHVLHILFTPGATDTEGALIGTLLHVVVCANSTR